MNPLATENRKMILGEVTHFEEAPEPNNILWENLWMTDFDFLKRLFGALCIIGALLTLSFWAIMQLNRKAIDLETMYPIVDCQAVR